MYTDLLHPKCLSIQQGDTLGLRADSSDAFYFFGHCLFDPCVCVCRANVANGFVLCLTAVYVWKCMLCARGCANAVVWRFLCVCEFTSLPWIHWHQFNYICMCLINEAGTPYLPVLMIQLLLVPMLLHVLLLNSFNIFLNQKLFQNNLFIAGHFETNHFETITKWVKSKMRAVNYYMWMILYLFILLFLLFYPLLIFSDTMSSVLATTWLKILLLYFCFMNLLYMSGHCIWPAFSKALQLMRSW